MVKHFLALFFALLAAPAFAQVSSANPGPGPLPPIHGAVGMATATPASNSGTTLKMLGLGGSSCLFTPTVSGNIQVSIYTGGGISGSPVAGDGFKVEILWGTGTAPVNGAAVTGTVIGTQSKVAFPITPTSDQPLQVTQNAVITGATPGVPIWLDAAEADNGANHVATVLTMVCTWAESP